MPPERVGPSFQVPTTAQRLNQQLEDWTGTDPGSGRMSGRAPYPWDQIRAEREAPSSD